MTVEEIVRHMECDDVQERINILFAVRMRTEQEVMKMHHKLAKIRRLEHNVSENPRFQSGFNEVEDITFCVECPYITADDRKTFPVGRGMRGIRIGGSDQFQFHTCEMIKNDDLGLENCRECERKIHFDRGYRCRIVYEGKEKFCKTLAEEYHKLEMFGYQPYDTLYITQKVIRQDGEEKMLFDTILPIKNND